MPETFLPPDVVAETSAEITDLVARPPGRVALAECLPRLVWHDVGVRVRARSGSIVEDIAFPTALRGALGHALLAGASRAVRTGEPCTFTPACAADVLYHVRRVPRGPEITPPYCTLVDRLDDGAALTMRVFGLATGWSPVIADALVRCIESGIFLPDGRSDPLAIETVAVIQGGFDAAASSLPIRSAALTALTPVALSDTSGGDVWSGLCLSMLTRLRTLLRWHGFLLDADWDDLDSRRRGHAVRVRGEGHTRFDRRSSRRGGRHAVAGDMLSLAVEGDLDAMAPLLLTAAVAGLGRRTTFGLGRVAVELR